MLRTVRDRLTAADPGFGRLLTAVTVTAGVGTTLPIELLVAHLLDVDARTTSAMALFGAVVAMNGSNALSTIHRRRDKWRAALGFPVAATLGLLGATATDSHHALQVLAFAVVLFVATWVRRFGGPWFAYGFLGWMGFFFATFLQVRWSWVDELVIGAVVASAWICLLGVSVLTISPRRLLHATLTSFFSRARGVARAAAELLELPASSVHRRRRALATLADRRAGLAETALLADAWSAEPDALPVGWSAASLRRRLIETQQSIERAAGAAIRIDAHGDDELRAGALSVVAAVAQRQDVPALLACEDLLRSAERPDRAGSQGGWSSRLLVHGVREFVRFDAAADEPPEVDPGETEFEAAAGLVSGGLPGTPSVAGDVAPRGRWNPVRHYSLTTRQAVQVAIAGVVALGLGTLLSPTRYYWAVIAAFVMFAGTSTRYETFNKGIARILGTLAGLVVAIGLAHVTVGHRTLVLAIIMVSIFGAFYLAKVSQTAMTFFITVLLGEMYTVLGTFSDSVLALRLGETGIGAAAGVGVALLFAPLSTRDTVRAARDGMLEAMVDLLESMAACLEGRPVLLDPAVRRLDDRARRVALVARPLTRPMARHGVSPRTRRRLLLYLTAVTQCRTLALAIQSGRFDADRVPAEVAALRAIADAARALAEQPPGAVVPAAEEPLVRGELAMFADPASARHPDTVVRNLHHLGATIGEVARSPDPARHRHG